MRDILPDTVVDAIGKQYRKATRDAVDDFEGQQGDEDSLTGALGSVLRRHVQGTLTVKGVEYTWKTTSRKLRGRGKGAPEKQTGMDAVVEIEVWANGELHGRKSLPVQSKKQWRGTDKKLKTQASQIAAIPGGGIVVDFAPNDYTAVSASIAVKAGGTRGKIPSDDIRSLGAVLADDFLECKIGSRSMYFDAERELLVHLKADGVHATPIGVGHRVLTKVTKQPAP